MKRSSTFTAPTHTLAENDFGERPAGVFDTASIGLESFDAQKASTRSEDGLDWDDLVEEGTTSIANLLEHTAGQINVFHNTTAGVQRIFLRLNHLFSSSFPTLLTTDLEYPGIVSLVDENWNGRLVMTRLADLIWNGRSDRVTEMLKQSVLASRPSVVYLSHVARSSGYRIDERIVRYIREVTPRTVIIIDGAQACGNIHVERALLDEVDFYVTSGHKWLCGKQTLGLVYAHSRWHLKDPAQSYSMTKGSTGTGNSSALLSLKTAVADLNGELTNQTAVERLKDIESHNSRLAQYFSNRMKQQYGLSSLGDLNSTKDRGWRWNGIVTIKLPSNNVILDLQEKQPRVKFTVLKSEPWRDEFGGDPPGKRYLLDCAAREVEDFFKPVNLRQEYLPFKGGHWSRFCFHYHHKKSHVDRLVSRIGRAMKRSIH